MCKVLTVMNMKGGVGKTTISTHLSSIVAHHSINERVKKVLVIDYDPQFNLSQAFLSVEKYRETEENNRNVLSILVENQVVEDPFTLQKPDSLEPPKVKDVVVRLFEEDDRVFDLLPSTLELMYLALGRSGLALTAMEKRFAKFMEEAKEIYDLIVIDCHPAGSLFTKTALSASDHVLVPITPHNYALRGVGLMYNFLNSPTFRRNKPKLHILFNHMPKSDDLIEQQIRANDRFGGKCLTSTMKKYSAYNGLVNGSGYVWQLNKAYSRMAYFNMRNIAVELLDKIYS